MERIEEGGRTLSEPEVIALEQRIGCRFPEPYRRFLLKHNGGRPRPYMQVVDIEHLPGGEADVNVFFGIDGPVESSNINWNIDTFKNRIANQLIPIACDSGGNLFCLSLTPADFGSVLYCDFDPGFGYHVSDSVIYYAVASDFNTFLEKMRSIGSN